jgi:HEAT repeat protein
VGKEAFGRKVQEVAALREAPEEAAIAQLRRALKDRSNYLVAKAAAVAAVRHFQALVPDLLAAFDRFMEDPLLPISLADFWLVLSLTA